MPLQYGGRVLKHIDKISYKDVVLELIDMYTM